jgi:hypothetical protein
MVRRFIPRGPAGSSIGRPPKPRRDVVAQTKADAALAARGYVYRGLEDAADGGVVAVAVNGRHVLMHLGRDKTDALFGLARVAAAPEGRS